MAERDEAMSIALEGQESWRDRAVERSLRAARAKAVMRGDSFVMAAHSLISESGSDFTVQQLIERSGMSLRTFYQHFGSKDALLLAVFEDVVRNIAHQWRQLADHNVNPLDKMRAVAGAFHSAPTAVPGYASGMRALAVFHLQLVDQKPREFARVVLPLHALIQEIIEEGVAAGSFRTDLSPTALATLVQQFLMSDTILQLALTDTSGGPFAVEDFWSFLGAALVSPGSEARAKPLGTTRRR